MASGIDTYSPEVTTTSTRDLSPHQMLFSASKSIRESLLDNLIGGVFENDNLNYTFMTNLELDIVLILPFYLLKMSMLHHIYLGIRN